VNDAALLHLKDCTGLASLWVRGTKVTDAGLEHLKGLNGLRYLLITETKVTAKGLAEFHAVLPGCTIEHDGGVIEPKK
jgi:hypothetical protein